MTQESLLSRFEMLLPLAAAWSTEQEEEILRDGVSLSAEEITDGRALGVQKDGDAASRVPGLQDLLYSIRGARP